MELNNPKSLIPPGIMEEISHAKTKPQHSLCLNAECFHKLK